MLMPACKNELLSFLKKAPKKLDVVVMPDFFLDRLINLNCGAPYFFSMVTDVADRKGGSIDGIAQTEIRGGNAINTASALAALGVKVTPIACTSKLGLQQINFYLKRYHVDTSHIKLSAKASLTTALEFKTENGKANVMLRDLGSLADFGPSNLNESDYEVIERVDYVCVFNWVGTRKFGTELAQPFFAGQKRKGRAKLIMTRQTPLQTAIRFPS